MEQTRTSPEKKAIKGASTTTCLTSPAQDRFQWLTSPTGILQMDVTVLCIQVWPYQGAQFWNHMSIINSPLRDDLHMGKGMIVNILEKFKGSMVRRASLRNAHSYSLQCCFLAEVKAALDHVREAPSLELLSGYNTILFHSLNLCLLNNCSVPGKMLWAKDTTLKENDDPIFPCLMDLESREREIHQSYGYLNKCKNITIISAIKERCCCSEIM